MYREIWRASDECHDCYMTKIDNNMTSGMTQIGWLILERRVIRIHIVWI